MTNSVIKEILDGKRLPATAEEKDLRGVVYCIVLNGKYYVGTTNRSIKERYANATSYYRTYKYEGTFYLIQQGGDLSALEKQLVNREDPLCLNKCAGGEGFGGGSNAKEVVLKSPDGVVHSFPSGSAAARYIGADRGNVNKVLQGKAINAAGWTLPSYEGVRRDGMKKAISITDGDAVYEFDSYHDCAAFIGCKNHTVSSLANGHTKSIYRKWRLA